MGFPKFHETTKSQTFSRGAESNPVFPVELRGLWVKTVLVPFWGRCTTHFSRDFSGDWDVHWGYGILTHGHVFLVELREMAGKWHCQRQVS